MPGQIGPLSTESKAGFSEFPKGSLWLLLTICEGRPAPSSLSWCVAALESPGKGALGLQVAENLTQTGFNKNICLGTGSPAWGCVSSLCPSGLQLPLLVVTDGCQQLGQCLCLCPGRRERRKNTTPHLEWRPPSPVSSAQPGPRLVARSVRAPSWSEKLAILGQVLRSSGGAGLGWE